MFVPNFMKNHIIADVEIFHFEVWEQQANCNCTSIQNTLKYLKLLHV